MVQLNLSLEKMPPQSHALYEQLKAKRGVIDGMYLTLLNHPGLTAHIGQLGTYLRFGATLPGDVREVAILLTAKGLKADYEWIKHDPCARQEGVSDPVIEAIKNGQPLKSHSEIYGLVEQLVLIVREQKNVPADLQDKLTKEFGVEGILELVVLVGFYTMIAGVISAFDVPLPAGSQKVFV